MNQLSYEHLCSEFGVIKADEIMRERAAVDRLKAAIQQIKADLTWYWRWGDGEGGYVLDLIADAVREAGETWPYDERVSAAPSYAKAKISRALAKRVFERDAYRCVVCGDHIDLTCDHIVPESKGGPTSLENLQAMCRPCNSSKGARG